MVLFENLFIYDVFNNVSRDKHSFIKKGEIKINNNDPILMLTFFKDVNALKNWIEKTNDKYDETLNITFTGELFKYTKTFDQI